VTVVDPGETQPVGLAAPRLYEGAVLQAVTGGCRRPGGLELTDRALSLTSLARGARVLDVGCGDGLAVEHLVRRHGLHATGVDPAAGLLRAGRRQNPGLDLREGRAERLPFADGAFDAVLAECSLSLAAEPSQAVAECARVLHHDGWLLVCDICRRAETPGRRRMFEEHGFDIAAWEDHSGLLARLIWDIVARHGSMAAFWQAAGVPAPPSGQGLGGLCYFLCVARLGAAGPAAGPAATGGESDETGKNGASANDDEIDDTTETR
jgi:arsenite methyltransferase